MICWSCNFSWTNPRVKASLKYLCNMIKCKNYDCFIQCINVGDKLPHNTLLTSWLPSNLPTLHNLQFYFIKVWKLVKNTTINNKGQWGKRILKESFAFYPIVYYIRASMTVVRFVIYTGTSPSPAFLTTISSRPFIRKHR